MLALTKPVPPTTTTGGWDRAGRLRVDHTKYERGYRVTHGCPPHMVQLPATHVGSTCPVYTWYMEQARETAVTSLPLGQSRGYAGRMRARRRLRWRQRRGTRLGVDPCVKRCIPGPTAS